MVPANVLPATACACMLVRICAITPWSDGEDAMADAAIQPLVTAERRGAHLDGAASVAHGSMRVVIADGQPLVRTGLESLLELEGDITVVGQANDAGEATTLTRETRPDVLLLDSELPGIDGIQLAQLILADPDLGGVNILLLGTCRGQERFMQAIRAGIRGVMRKDGPLDQLADAVRAVARGEVALTPTGTRRLMAEIAAQPDVHQHIPEQLEELTAREREVVALVAGGLSNGEIAQHLVVSHATVKTHVSRALHKLQLHDRAQLVRLAYETGLVVARQGVSALSGTATIAAA
jgi:DNA-binding NarL/FixJ family response regulator